MCLIMLMADHRCHVEWSIGDGEGQVRSPYMMDREQRRANK